MAVDLLHHKLSMVVFLLCHDLSMDVVLHHNLTHVTVIGLTLTLVIVVDIDGLDFLGLHHNCRKGFTCVRLCNVLIYSDFVQAKAGKIGSYPVAPAQKM